MELLYEFIGEIGGTFLFILIILIVVQSKYLNAKTASINIGLPIGLGLALSIFIFGGLSKTHFNPALSFIMFLKDPRIFSLNMLIIYVIAQLIGGFCALKINENFIKSLTF